MVDGRMTRIESEERLVGVWTSDAKTQLVVACEKVCEYFNVDPDQGLRGAPLHQFMDAVHPDDRSELDRRIRLAISKGDSFVASYRVRSALHGARWVQASGQCFERDGVPTHLSGYLTEADPPGEGAGAQSGDVGPSYDAILDHLQRARHLAADVSEPVLARLIEAVMLEAGFCLARRLGRPDKDGNGDGGGAGGDGEAGDGAG